MQKHRLDFQYFAISQFSMMWFKEQFLNKWIQMENPTISSILAKYLSEWCLQDIKIVSKASDNGSSKTFPLNCTRVITINKTSLWSITPNHFSDEKNHSYFIRLPSAKVTIRKTDYIVHIWKQVNCTPSSTVPCLWYISLFRVISNFDKIIPAVESYSVRYENGLIKMDWLNYLSIAKWMNFDGQFMHNLDIFKVFSYEIWKLNW